jgi:hypothetical protein
MEDFLMSVWPGAVAPAHFLAGADGELVSLRISTDPRALEDLLDCLSRLSFPINPEIFHGVPTMVEFPAYEARLYEVRSALRAYGFDADALQVRDMLEAISAS